MKLAIIIASTRPGRLGPAVAAWFEDFANNHTSFDIDVLDLADINLPMFDEPLPPMMDQYANNHTKAWAKHVAAADAFVIVTPEYNYSMPPALVNAVDYLHKEWKYKPVGFVGYGGVGAARAIEMEKQLFSALHMVPLHDSVLFPATFAPMKLAPTEHQEHAAKSMLSELEKWATATRTMR
ncbi:MAG TPA: NAD(P)H-dependent oxidoreductase [Magnetospirillaceae bacterium]|nr:NAD(P)H-dependent oxidoreductase [Magnetospirillaceae bacterium]